MRSGHLNGGDMGYGLGVYVIAFLHPHLHQCLLFAAASKVRSGCRVFGNAEATKSNWFIPCFCKLFLLF